MKKMCLAIILMFIVCGGSQDSSKVIPKPEENLPQINKSVLMVIAPQNFRDEEYKEPFDLFTKSGIKVTTASIDTLPAKGMLGMVIKPDLTLEQITPDSFDALVIVGGSGCQVLWDNKTLHGIVASFNKTGKTVAAICIAPVVLARVGILKDIKATAFSTVKDEIVKCGGQYTGNGVEVVGNIVTGSGPQAAKDFADAILERLKEQ